MKKNEKLSNLGISAFCESVAMMVHAGIPTDEAVSLLDQENKKEGPLGLALQDMHKAVEAGESLSQAMEDAGIFPEYAIRMLRAGEDSGNMEEVLFRLSSYYADQETMSAKLKTAVIYPAAMLVLIIAVLTVLLTMVLPAFRGVYDKLTGSAAASAYAYIRWANGICAAALAVMILIAVLLFAGLLLWRGSGRAKVEAMLMKVPFFASLLERLGLYRFTAALEMFLAGGEMQDDAVRKSMSMVFCAPLEAKLEKCLEHMNEGHGFAQAAYEESLFEPVYGRMLLAGERGGNLETVLGRLRSILSESCIHSTDRIVNTVDPLLAGILMLAVGFSLLSVMLPLIGMMNAIG